ncbi:MAG: hypothetical protein V2A73_11745 [Pseudomonadota bacterium]
MQRTLDHKPRGFRGLVQRTRTIFVLVLVTGQQWAVADGIDLVGTEARAIGRAGADVVSGDGAGALYQNPAGIARRSTTRAQVGLSLNDRSASYQASFAATSPQVESRAGAELTGWAGVQFGIGRLTLGVAYLAPTFLSTAYSLPPDYNTVLADESVAHPQRYASVSFKLRRQGIGVAAAARVLPWLAVGGAALAFNVSLAEERMLWAGSSHSPADPTGLDSRYDMLLSVSGEDRFVPAGSLGILVAPEEVPLELAATVFVSADAVFTGRPELRNSRWTVAERPGIAGVVDSRASAKAYLGQPAIGTVGARFLARRWALELEGSLARIARRVPQWTVDGVEIVPADRASEPRRLEHIPPCTMLRNTYGARGAVEVDLVPGFVVLTAGYSFDRAFTPADWLGPALPSLDAHTVAVGVEMKTEGVAVSLSVARTEHIAAKTPLGSGEIVVLSPYGEEGIRAASGHYDGAVTQIAVGVEMEM